jgi:hypothetical protein
VWENPALHPTDLESKTFCMTCLHSPLHHQVPRKCNKILEKFESFSYLGSKSLKFMKWKNARGNNRKPVEVGIFY